MEKSKYNVGAFIGFLILYIVIFSVVVGVFLLYLIPSFVISIFGGDLLSMVINLPVWSLIFIVGGVILGVLAGLKRLIIKPLRKSSILVNVSKLLYNYAWVSMVLALMFNLSGGFALVSSSVEIFGIELSLMINYYNIFMIAIILLVVILIIKTANFITWIIYYDSGIEKNLIFIYLK